MGYTHYWTPKPISAADWVNVQEDFANLTITAKREGIKLGDGNGQGINPINGADFIAFNGRGEAESHETAWFDREGEEWSFCKTAQKPYDTVVTASLVYLAARHGYVVTTDGEAVDWLPGVKLARKAFGGSIVVRVNDEGEVSAEMR